MIVDTLQQPSSSTLAASLERFNFELLKPLLHTLAGPRPFLPGHMRPWSYASRDPTFACNQLPLPHAPLWISAPPVIGGKDSAARVAMAPLCEPFPRAEQQSDDDQRAHEDAFALSSARGGWHAK